MTPRHTWTGAVLEAMLLPALDRGGYTWRVQVETGTRPSGRRHQVDAIAEEDGASVLIGRADKGEDCEAVNGFRSASGVPCG